MTKSYVRSQWKSRFGFVLAAAGSAVGLGNIWKFPYICGENGGGLFVLIYLACISLVGLPIMIAEVLIGRTTRKSPVGAFRSLSAPASPWLSVGWLGVASAFVILSYYSVVAGWALHYIFLSAKGAFVGMEPSAIGDVFGAVTGSKSIATGWHTVFMVLVTLMVLGGVQRGIERWNLILMPLLFLMLLVLLAKACTMDGFKDGLRFVFAPNADHLTRAGVLEALGHSFFTLSLGMGAMLTYGSYLRTTDDVVSSSVLIAFFDTLIALLACLILFPITFTFGMEPATGPGLVFQNMSIAFSQMPGGRFWATLFFVLLSFAAFTSAMSLLEVAVSYFMDEKNWSRAKASLVCGVAILLLGVPSALSFSVDQFGADGIGRGLARIPVFTGDQPMSWFDFFDHISANWMLPIGGLGIALFLAWRVGNLARQQVFTASTRWGRLYWGWLCLLRYVVPVAVLLVFLNAVGWLPGVGD